jgi:hypothetical protein
MKYHHIFKITSLIIPSFDEDIEYLKLPYVLLGMSNDTTTWERNLRVS